MKNLEQLFKESSKGRFLFVQPGGNWGDHLIYWGAETLANKLNIDYLTTTKDEFLSLEPNSSDHVYIHGGGAFNQWSSDAGFKCFEHAVTHYSQDVIYGPCTTSMDERFLQHKFDGCLRNILAKKITLFARELKTFELIKKIEAFAGKVDIQLDKDTALYLSKKDILRRVGPEKTNYEFYAYRADKEASELVGKQNLQNVIFDPAIYANSFEHWIRLHLHAAKIITNRTHSSIIGAILEKDTTLLESKYHKNQSIWQYSLKELNVQWLTTKQAQFLISPKFLYKLLPNFVSTSWKAGKLFLWLSKVPSK
jgi:exopolysaccharide biosynthesis predicted pyruvyltransferase EpsI